MKGVDALPLRVNTPPWGEGRLMVWYLGQVWGTGTADKWFNKDSMRCGVGCVDHFVGVYVRFKNYTHGLWLCSLLLWLKIDLFTLLCQDCVIGNGSLSQHLMGCSRCRIQNHDDVIKRRHFPRYWPFLRGIHRSPVNSPHKGQWRGALIFSVIFAWTNGWVNNRDAGALRPHNDSLWRHGNVNGPKLHYYCRRIFGMLNNNEAN